MKRLLLVIAMIVAIGAAIATTPTTEQAHDTWQPRPMGLTIVDQRNPNKSIWGPDLFNDSVLDSIGNFHHTVSAANPT